MEGFVCVMEKFRPLSGLIRELEACKPEQDICALEKGLNHEDGGQPDSWESR